MFLIEVVLLSVEDFYVNRSLFFFFSPPPATVENINVIELALARSLQVFYGLKF